MVIKRLNECKAESWESIDFYGLRTTHFLSKVLQLTRDSTFLLSIKFTVREAFMQGCLVRFDHDLVPVLSEKV